MLKEKRQPQAKWAAKVCQYAVKKGHLDLWHDCGAEGILELDGDFYCMPHWDLLRKATR